MLGSLSLFRCGEGFRVPSFLSCFFFFSVPCQNSFRNNWLIENLREPIATLEIFNKDLFDFVNKLSS